MKSATTTVPPLRRRAASASLALSMLLASLGTSIANVALPSLAAAFDAPFSEVRAVVVSYLAALTVAVVLAGRIGDRYGLRAGIAGGAALFAAAAALAALAPDLVWLTAARFAQGLGAAFLMALSMALMRKLARPEEIGKAMGLLGTISALGTALGPALGGLMIPAWGWQSIFWIQVPLASAALILTLTTLPKDGAEERRTSLSLRAVLDASLLPALAVNLLVAAVMMTTLVVAPFYLALGLGLDETRTGLMMAVGPAISIASGVPSGRLVDAFGARRVLAAGLGLLAAGAFMLSVLPNAIGAAGYLLAIAVLTPGYQLFQAANNTTALADVPPASRGTVSGLLSFSRNLGLIGGASCMGLMFSLGTGTDDLAHAAPAAIARGMRVTFAAAGVLVMLAWGIDRFAKRRRAAEA
ncbi:MFS transporter [Gellertiella hungarica]|uniref:MFS family permease n=1 Tax=Gellertiella hungarica TaxID=1572859 RepID=A0A7W6NMF8_9HYPH|nr:MFS transporter [Gellertiella hungarica]MBB4066579.1 MFS family permease [Gellertiella hungarica]